MCHPPTHSHTHTHTHTHTCLHTNSHFMYIHVYICYERHTNILDMSGSVITSTSFLVSSLHRERDGERKSERLIINGRYTLSTCSTFFIEWSFPNTHQDSMSCNLTHKQGRREGMDELTPHLLYNLQVHCLQEVSRPTDCNNP